jgi:hypothetical protein
LADLIEPCDVDGRTILVGITRQARDGSHEQEQFVGIAGIEDRETYALVRLRCDDGEMRDYPFDARTLQRAPAGEYRLRSTGQVVRNPDFLMTWIMEE